jgi:23S rRNA (guanosine2251-2'-O)-methyltransferase
VVDVVDDARAHASTSAPQGVVARCRPLPTVSLEAAVAAVVPAAVLVLDHLEDPRNVGAIARSAAAAGVGAIVTPGRRSAPLGATAFKAAAGALEIVRVAEVSSVPAALDDLRRFGVWSVGLDAAGERPLWGLDLLTEPVAVVVGAEDRGLARLTGARCDVVVSIPMTGVVESLNASVAASLAVFEVARVRAGRPG